MDAGIFVLIDFPLRRDILANDKNPRPDLNALSIPEAGIGLYDLNVTLIHSIHVASWSG
jgi:hypothetical protein